MITAHNITKSFGDMTILHSLDLEIKKGSIYGIAGKSGVGKSTLLRCMNGLEKYDNGELRVDGVDVKGLSPNGMMCFRKNIGMIFQNFALLERLTVYDNIALPLRCWKYKSGFIDKKVRELLEVVEIPEKINQKPRELSGGQKQRVAIARALTMDPYILLCDEATSALDPKTSKAIIALLKQINRQMGITIVFVTHQMSILRGLCREIAILENGRVADFGKVEEVFRRQSGALINLLGEEVGISMEGCVKSTVLSETAMESFIPRMAVNLGIDITIQGGRSTFCGEKSQGLVIRFPEKDNHLVARYLSGHNVKWKILQPLPVEERKDNYQMALSLIQPEIA
ncbi:MAG: methionine ABC transporter ATP-binding protein [Deltaproteobacteria bacterium]|nr:methionine ABC transporter ATP-binding protein [Deltaproteobacteria bacterium]